MPDITNFGKEKEFRGVLSKEGQSEAALMLFRDIIWDHFEEFGRPFPWRDTTDPHAILVSEIMLQQTQTGRVAEKFPAFMEEFPNFRTLADAPLSAVLKAWQGMGYNRRAVSLKRTAETVMEQGGELPASPDELLKLPGIGPYTAAAICAFAFNMPTVFIETNIRRVFIHFFFPGEDKVSDAQIRPLVERTVDQDRAREWYWALMDYGVLLAKQLPNPNRRSRSYTKQKKFEGSSRQLRGKVLKVLLEEEGLSREELEARVEKDERLEKVLVELEKEGFVREEKGKYQVREK